MDTLTRQKLEIVLHDADALASDVRSMLEEPSRNEPTARDMTRALLASTGGKRYGWADEFGVDEVTIRKWAAGKRKPNPAHLKTLKRLYGELNK